MNIFEKYKLYRHVMKQRPYFTTGYSDKKNYNIFYLNYSTDDCLVDIFFDRKTKKYTATVIQSKKVSAYFKSSFFAKKLFNHGRSIL
jgi:hypothetical protein